DVNTTFSNALFSIWGKRKEFQSFIDFYDKNKDDLKLFGFDYQITGTDGIHTLTRDLFEYSKKNKFKFKLRRMILNCCWNLFQLQECLMKKIFLSANSPIL